MSRTAVFVAGITLMLLGIGTARGSGPVPPGYSVAESSTVHPGVRYERIVKPARPILAHVARIEPGAAVDVRVVSGRDKVPNRFGDLETTGSMCRRVQCIIGVNGDFHVREQPVGGVITGGRMLRSPDPSRPQLTIDAGGNLTAGGFPWTGAVVFSNGTRIPVAGINVSPRDGLILYTDDWGAQTSAPGRVEVVLATPKPAGLLNQPTPAELRSRRAVPGPIPAGGAVLSASGAAAETLEKAWRDYQQKVVTSKVRLLVESPVKAAESLGANPVVLRGGRRALPWPPDSNVIAEVHPRTLVGWNSGGDRFIVAVDGRQPASAGLTMAEAADFLLALGATDAVNLDGGGGTTFVVDGALRNRPSDHADQNPPPERVAPNALVVLARRPGGPGTPASPVSPLAAGPAAGDDESPTPPDAAVEGGPVDDVMSRPRTDAAPGTGDRAVGLGPGDAVAAPDGSSGGFHSAGLGESAPRGALVAATTPPGPEKEGPGRSEGTSPTHPDSDGPRPDEAVRALGRQPVAGLAPRPGRRSLVEQPLTKAAATLAFIQAGVLAAAVRRRRLAAVDAGGGAHLGR